MPDCCSGNYNLTGQNLCREFLFKSPLSKAKFINILIAVQNKKDNLSRTVTICPYFGWLKTFLWMDVAKD